MSTPEDFTSAKFAFHPESLDFTWRTDDGTWSNWDDSDLTDSDLAAGGWEPLFTSADGPAPLMSNVTFDDIRIGDTIRRTITNKIDGSSIISAGVVDSFVSGVAYSKEGVALVSDFPPGTDHFRVIDILARSKTLPTEPGSLVRVDNEIFRRNSGGLWQAFGSSIPYAPSAIAEMDWTAVEFKEISE